MKLNLNEWKAIEIAQPWPSIDRGLREPSLPDRLDVIVEAMQVIGLLSVDVDPALPVTRKQAEAAKLRIRPGISPPYWRSACSGSSASDRGSAAARRPTDGA